MPRHYQILRIAPKSPNDVPGVRRWRFHAHGATFTCEEAEETCKHIAKHTGDKTRIIAI